MSFICFPSSFLFGSLSFILLPYFWTYLCTYKYCFSASTTQEGEEKLWGGEHIFSVANDIQRSLLLGQCTGWGEIEDTWSVLYAIRSEWGRENLLTLFWLCLTFSGTQLGNAAVRCLWCWGKVWFPEKCTESKYCSQGLTWVGFIFCLANYLPF